jgi:membrane fusion protein, copper/silver efflux system
MSPLPKLDWRSLSVGAVVVGVLLLGAVVVQHLRHGWPFSLHHNQGATAEATHANHTPSTDNTSPASPRAPVELDPSRLAGVGVRVELVQRETSSRPLRAIATVVPDESRLSHVHTRVSGWIEQLTVNTTGQTVRAGQPLAGIFSQELLSSQNEYLAARRAAGSGPTSIVAQGARSRLKVFGMTDAEIRTIEQSGEARRLVTVSAPRSGVVIHRGISVGTAVDPSTELVVIADLSSVWVLAEVPEADIPLVQRETPATLDFPGSGRPPFEGKVEFLYPTLSERTRTLRVRFVVENKSGTLRPGLYGTVEFRLQPREAVTVPRDAIVDSGDTQHVFVVEGEGRFAPRAVKLGERSEDRVEVLDGLSAGESIVASGVFLIDSESRLRASGGGAGHAHGAAKDTALDTPSAVQRTQTPPADSRAPPPPANPPQRPRAPTAMPKAPPTQPVPGPTHPTSSGHQGH